MFGEKFLDEFSGSKKIIVPYLVFMLSLVATLVFAFSDYYSSYLGYAMWPSKKPAEITIVMVALLPQLGQTISFILFQHYRKKYNSNKKDEKSLSVIVVCIITFIICHIFDYFTDLYFKAGMQIENLSLFQWIAYTVEIELIYSLASEIGFSVCIAVVLDYYKQASFHILELFYEIASSFISILFIFPMAISDAKNRKIALQMIVDKNKALYKSAEDKTSYPRNSDGLNPNRDDSYLNYRPFDNERDANLNNQPKREIIKEKQSDQPKRGPGRPRKEEIKKDLLTQFAKDK